MSEAFWLRRARREAALFNLGWWAQAFLPWVISAGVAGCAVILALRTAGTSWWWAIFGLGFLLFVGAVVAGLVVRRHFLTCEESLVRLDADLRLHNALTASRAAVRPWPQPRPEARFALRWKWFSLIWPPLAALALILLAAWIPLPSRNGEAARERSEPPSWTATQEKIDDLRQEDLVEPAALEEFQKELDSLRQKPAEEWYRHESLEAGDHLQEQLGENLSALQQNLETALGALEVSRQLEQAQFQAMAGELMQAMQGASQALGEGKLPLDQKTLEQLKGLDPSQMRQLSPEQARELAEKLQQGIASASEGESQGEGAAQKMMEGLKSAGSKDSAGQGGVDRGPGTEPLTLSEKEKKVDGGAVQALQNDDLSRAQVGDSIGVTQGRHEVDKAAPAPASGGGMGSPGSGADGTWQQTATPDEQRALKQFFN